jgi:hypothetical protein
VLVNGLLRIIVLRNNFTPLANVLTVSNFALWQKVEFLRLQLISVTLLGWKGGLEVGGGEAG